MALRVLHINHGATLMTRRLGTLLKEVGIEIASVEPVIGDIMESEAKGGGASVFLLSAGDFGRDSMDVLAYLKEAVPVAFRHAYLYDIAPQLGYRCSYRLKGEYVMTANDFAFAKQHDDVIAWHSTICQLNDCGPVEIPYRAILPQKIDGLLCPGRHLSADNVAIDWLNLIPQCVGTGQAAGVAAAVAVANGTTVRDVDIRRVQDILAGEQDVPLPRNEHTDPSYTEMCEEHEYGLYTDLAKEAARARKENGESDSIKAFRQW